MHLVGPIDRNNYLQHIVPIVGRNSCWRVRDSNSSIEQSAEVVRLRRRGVRVCKGALENRRIGNLHPIECANGFEFLIENLGGPQVVLR